MHSLKTAFAGAAVACALAGGAIAQDKPPVDDAAKASASDPASRLPNV